MAILGIGNDIIEISRIAKNIEQYGQKFLDRLFTNQEQAYCLQYRQSDRHFAGRFAAKEAIVKAFGTGFGTQVAWTDLEILNDPSGKPHVRLSAALELRLPPDTQIFISISHCKEYATACAIWTDEAKHQSW
ncbi:holo-ACP synthase [Parachlamydia sp. AcF125]|uniref:holo-ACP synthase n=1 Tax=Parachlamydia sp. AcF125 TaxID=2795736 RepID=UPI001BC9FBB6|nr:holo-ACP synthase [Parachlamydia sp. AcF125]MBS4168889.1 Holo-[acyl-carrier-protein] synthase [Parachlamydia sp. AcF125]